MVDFDKICKRDLEYVGTKYGSTHWLRTVVTPCSEDPKKWDGITAGENMNVHKNLRVQEAIEICKTQCHKLIECGRMGDRIRDFAPGIYGGEYKSSKRW
jgi:hypothetical protein